MPRPRFTALDPAKRRAILDAAADVFASDGYEGASYNQIIARAGVSKGAMYYYFDDKADLYRTIIRDVSERMIRASGELDAYDDARSFWAAVGALCGRMLAFVGHEPRLPGLAKSLLAAAEGPLAQELAQMMEEMRAYTEGLVESGRQLGAVRDDLPASLLTHLLLGLGEAFDRWMIPRWQEMDPTELAALPDRIVELTLEHWELSRDRLESFVSPDPRPLDVATPKDREHAL